MSIELALLAEIVSLASDPDCDLGEFEARVLTSPRLAQEVTRVANSALYGMSGRITRLDRAVLILGRRAVADIAAAAAVAARFSRFAGGPVSVDALWQHSLTVAQGARLLARAVGSPLAAEAYLLGLLHDLAIPELAVRGDDLDEAQAHGPELASQARDWGFPELLCQAISAHHAADPPEDGDARVLVGLTQAAHAIAPPDPLGFDDDPADVEECARRLGSLGLDASDAEELREELAAELKESTAVLATPRQARES